MEVKGENVYKVTLSSGKIVLIRELKIKHQELAAMAVGNRVSPDNKVVYGIAMQKELLKMLLVQVAGKQVSGAEVENLDNLFSFVEYSQLQEVISKLMGGESLGNAVIEMQPCGDT